MGSHLSVTVSAGMTQDKEDRLEDLSWFLLFIRLYDVLQFYCFWWKSFHQSVGLTYFIFTFPRIFLEASHPGLALCSVWHSC